MVLPMITAAVTLFYLGAVPIHIAVRLNLGQNSGLRIGFSVFEPRFALRHAARLPSGAFHPPARIQNMDPALLLKSAVKAIKYALEHIHVDRIDLHGVFGSDDAALTALVCGCASAISCALRSSTGRNVRIRLNPDFSGGPVRAELTGMISVRVGHIMLAALLGAYQYGSRRLKTWTGTPLRAS